MGQNEPIQLSNSITNETYFILINIIGKKELGDILHRSPISLQKHLLAYNTHGKRGRYLSYKALLNAQVWFRDFIVVYYDSYIIIAETQNKSILEVLPMWLAKLAKCYTDLFGVFPLDDDMCKRIIKLKIYR